MAESIPISEYQLARDECLVVIGAGGFTGEQLYLRSLAELEIPEEQIILVEHDQDRLRKARERHPKSRAYTDTETSLADLPSNGLAAAGIIIATNTAAHGDNLRSITKASQDDNLDLQQAKILCEKPLVPPEESRDIRQLAAQHPELDIYVGYILRHSGALTALQDYVDKNTATVSGLTWLYGKDRTKDPRPSQGVYPDEVVHPLSVTDLVLQRAIGSIAAVSTVSAAIKYEDFVNPAAQLQARNRNPNVPERPSSDINTNLVYSCDTSEGPASVPVSIHASFRLRQSVRQATIHIVDSPDLVVTFDTKEQHQNGRARMIDRLATADGTVLHEWDGDKSTIQIKRFLQSRRMEASEAPDTLTTFEGEMRVQDILAGIGRTAIARS